MIKYPFLVRKGKNSFLILLFCMAIAFACNNNNNAAKVTEDTTAVPDGTVKDTTTASP